VVDLWYSIGSLHVTGSKFRPTRTAQEDKQLLGCGINTQSSWWISGMYACGTNVC